MSAQALKVGVGQAVCWVARCDECGWQHPGSSRRAATAREWRDSHRCEPKAAGLTDPELRDLVHALPYSTIPELSDAQDVVQWFVEHGWRRP